MEKNVVTDQDFQVRTVRGTRITNPPLARFLFDDTRMAPVWLIVRILVGVNWLQAALGKWNNPAWRDTGEALRGFWQNAVSIPEAGRPPISFDWYRSFIQSMLDAGAYTWFSKLVMIGETAIGIALILGVFTGIAAFFGGFMNWNFLMAGTASTNPLMFVGALLLMFAWKTAGWIGLDRFLLPLIGVPWIREEPLRTPTRERAPGAP
jgi:thiosulfate dehydrogenase [quinone] large subunit